MPAYVPDLPAADSLPGGPGRPAGVYQGGSTPDLHKLLGVQVGGQVRNTLCSCKLPAGHALDACLPT